MHELLTLGMALIMFYHSFSLFFLSVLKMFDKIPGRNIASYSMLIPGLGNNSCFKNSIAIKVFYLLRFKMLTILSRVY